MRKMLRTQQTESEKKASFKKPFLKRGQGIARFGMKSTRLKFKNKPKASSSSTSARVGPQRGPVLRSASSPALANRQQDAELDDCREVSKGYREYHMTGEGMSK